MIRAGRVLAEPGHGPPLGPTEIHVENGHIVRLEPVDGLTALETDRLILPALANAHDHGRGLRTLAFEAADAPLETWMPALGKQPRVDPYLDALVAFGRMARNGIGATNHCHTPQNGTALPAEAETVARAARDVGIRVAFGLPFFDRNPVIYGDLDDFLDRLDPADRPALIAQAKRMRPVAMNMEFAERIAELESPYFSLQYHPVAPQWAAPETLAAIAEKSAATGRRVHTHLLETERQRLWADRQYPQGFIRFLDEIGFLSPRLTVAHGVWLRPDEIALLAERGVTVSINLSSNRRLRSGEPPLAGMRAAGVRFGLGLDAMSFDDDEDMLREIRLVGRLNAVTTAELFDAALVAGRRTILGEDGGGRIAVGAPADFLVLDYGAMVQDCIGDETEASEIILARAASRHVASLVVGGREVARDGRCVGVDIEAAETELVAQARAHRRSDPPDMARIARLQAALESYYDAR